MISAIISAVASVLRVFSWLTDFFTTRAIQQTEDQKIEAKTAKGELKDVEDADKIRDALRTTPPDKLRDSPNGFFRD